MQKMTKAFWAAYKSLYSNAAPEPVKPRKKPSRDEEIEQEKYNYWFAAELEPKGYRWFHVPNGGYRNQIQGAKFKRQGVKKGIPDIVVPVPRKPYHGLIIELKRVNGVASDVKAEQKDWLRWFRAQGWSAHVAFGFEHAKQITEKYLNVE